MSARKMSFFAFCKYLIPKGLLKCGLHPIENAGLRYYPFENKELSRKRERSGKAEREDTPPPQEQIECSQILQIEVTSRVLDRNNLALSD